MQVKYIDNDMSKGVLYDYDLIIKEYKKLKIPKDYFNPTHLPFNKSAYFHLMSIRGTGKTTNLLLLGMVQNKLYGTIISYIRQTENQIMPKFTSHLFNVIIENGYIEKITDGKYNNVTYKSRRYYYCKTNDKGDIEDVCPNYFMVLLAVDKWQDYKSTFNEPLGDVVIFDEYISDVYRPNEFPHLMQVLSTIFRDRESGKVYLLSNTINKESVYFIEFEIYKELASMDFGDWKLIKSSHGTMNYVEIIKSTDGKDKKRKITKQLYFGFNNPQLASITGSCLWATKEYQHIPTNKELFKEDEITKEKNTLDTLIGNYYLSHLGKYIRLRLCYSSVYGIMVLVTRATNIYDDSIVYSLDNMENPRCRYAIGYDKIDKLIWRQYSRNRFYYQDNDLGNFIDNYLIQSKGNI